MPEPLMVNLELLLAIYFKKLEEKGYVHGKNKLILKGSSLPIFQGMKRKWCQIFNSEYNNF